MQSMGRMAELRQDLGFAGRQIRKSPGFTLMAILTLALGIGATTAIFSAVYSLVLRPLPFHEAGRLVLGSSIDSEGEVHRAFSAPNFLDWQATSHTLAGATSVEGATLNLSRERAEPERLQGALVGANFFKVLGIPPLAGRTFAPGEDRANAPRVAVISEKLWRRLYGGDPGVIGRTVILNGEPHTLIGILQRGVQLPSSADVWVPKVFSADELRERGAVFFSVIARLAPGATLEQARAEANVIGRQLAAQSSAADTGFRTLTVIPLADQIVGDTRKPLLILLGAVSFVLLIACVNVANLLLVRAAGRESEIVIRTALGAGRGRIVRQLLTESLVLALSGGVAGVALAALLVKALIALGPQEIPRLELTHIDGPTLLFALAVSLLTGLLFGLAPALQTSRTNLSGVMREGTRGSKGRAGSRARGLLVILEAALAVVLLACAGLLIRSFSHLQNVAPGFQPDHAVTFKLELPRSRYRDAEQLRTFTDALIERLQQLPGVRSAGATVAGMPLSSGENVLTFAIAGRPPAPAGKEDSIRVASITPDYMEALGTRLTRGRRFTVQDRAGAPNVVLVNEAAARRYFPGEEPLGHRIDLGGTLDRSRLGGEIVGVVADIKQDALDKDIEPAVFLPYDQAPERSLSLVLRSSGADSQALIISIRSQVHELDPDLPVYAVQALSDLIATSTSQSRFYMLLLGSFAATALLLAAVGIYGVIAYSVHQRTQEIGIRMALGASRLRVLRMVVGQGMVLTLTGAAAGLLAAFVATQGMRSLLFEVKASDPATYVAVALVLVAVAAVASYLPARRAARTEPNLALRGQV